MLPKLKASRGDVDKLRGILVDFDPVDEQVVSPAFYKEAVCWISKLLEIPTSAMTAVWSGRGLQVILELQIVPVTDALETELRTAALLKHLHDTCPFQHVVVDKKTYDLARVARMPATVNSRTGNVAKTVWTARQRIDGTLLLRSFEPSLPAAPSTRIVVPQTITRAWLLTHLNETAARFIFEGSEYPNRHHEAYATARCLFEIGIAEEEAIKIVLDAAKNCRPKPLAPVDAIRQVRSAYAAALSVLRIGAH